MFLCVCDFCLNICMCATSVQGWGGVGSPSTREGCELPCGSWQHPLLPLFVLPALVVFCGRSSVTALWASGLAPAFRQYSLIYALSHWLTLDVLCQGLFPRAAHILGTTFPAELQSLTAGSVPLSRIVQTLSQKISVSLLGFTVCEGPRVWARHP